MRYSGLLLILFFLSGPNESQAQKNDYLWPLGLGPSYSEFRFFLNFNQDPPSILLRSDTMSTGIFTGAYSNDKGELIAYSNGLRILNKDGELIENAFGLNPTLTQGQTQGSYGGHQSGFFLRNPDNPNILYFIHMDNGYHPANVWPYRFVGRHLMATTIDLSANNGAGKAITKNEILIDGLLMNPAAVRHANGRDWWIMVSDADENRHYRLLLTPDGFLGPFTQEIGTKPSPVGKQNSGAGNTFSPAGNFYVDNNSYIGFSVFNFDRCTGLLSNEKRVDWPPPVPPQYVLRYESGSGVVFSPDERLLYITATYQLSDHPAAPKGKKPYLFQFDLAAPDLAASIDTINFVDPLNFWPYKYTVEVMWGAEMGPDGRIYIVHSGDAYCTVQYPNVRGKGCGFRYNEPGFNNVIGDAIPVFPNYRLGPLDGSPCDTLGLNNVPVANYRIEDTLTPLARFFYDLSYREPATWHWTFGDGTVSQDTSPMHEYAQPGKYQVCLTVSNTNGSDTYCRYIFLGITGQEEAPAEQSALIVYPNPARERVWVTLQGATAVGRDLVVSDLYGRKILKRSWGSDPSADLDIRGWPAGVYVLTAETASGKPVSCRLVVGP